MTAHTTAVTPEFVRGAVELERTPRGILPHRLPRWARQQLPDPQLLGVEAQPAGVRLVFETEATWIELVAQPTRVVYVGAAGRPSAVCDLVIDGEVVAQSPVTGGDEMHIDMLRGTQELHHGEPGAARFDGLPAGPKTVELWLPWNERTELVELRTDAPVAAAEASESLVWLHHGSSISHGSNALRPTGTWPAIAARAAGVELVNLGFGGGAMLDGSTARTLRDLPADRVSVKIGINIVNGDIMRRRAFVPAVHAFLDTIREGHPDVPLLVISPIHCPIHEETPGPGAVDPASLGTDQVRFIATGDPGEVARGALTLRVIREELEGIVARRAETDPQLSYLDGVTLYGPVDFAEHPLADGLHPGAEAHAIMGERFAAGWLSA